MSGIFPRVFFFFSALVTSLLKFVLQDAVIFYVPVPWTFGIAVVLKIKISGFQWGKVVAIIWLYKDYRFLPAPRSCWFDPLVILGDVIFADVARWLPLLWEHHVSLFSLLYMYDGWFNDVHQETPTNPEEVVWYFSLLSNPNILIDLVRVISDFIFLLRERTSVLSFICSIPSVAAAVTVGSKSEIRSSFVTD